MSIGGKLVHFFEDDCFPDKCRTLHVYKFNGEGGSPNSMKEKEKESKGVSQYPLYFVE